MKTRFAHLTVTLLLIIATVIALPCCANSAEYDFHEHSGLYAAPLSATNEVRNSMLALSTRVSTDEWRYGRNLLEGMSNANGLLYAYDKIADGVKNTQAEIMLANSSTSITGDELNLVFEAVLSDFPEYFWLDLNYNYTFTDKVRSISPAYKMTGSALDSAKVAFESAINEMISGLDGKSDYEKAKLLHDRLSIAVDYNFTENDQNSYGALVEKKAVCAGYTRAYQILMQRAGIPAWYVAGSSINPSSGQPEAHAWNLVSIDGKYYYTDVTWDDQGAEANSVFYAYFNITTSQLLEDHTISNEGIYKYYNIVCSDTDANYFKINDSVYSAFDTTKIADGLRKNALTYRVYVSGDTNAFISSYRDNIVAIAGELGIVGQFSYSWKSLGHELILMISGNLPTHTYGELIAEVPATHSEDGMKAHYKCPDCGKYFTEDKDETTEAALKISKISHSYEQKYDADNHWKECACKDFIEKAKHTDSDNNGRCDTCNYSMPIATTQPEATTSVPETTKTPETTKAPETTKSPETTKAPPETTTVPKEETTKTPEPETTKEPASGTTSPEEDTTKVSDTAKTPIEETTNAPSDKETIPEGAVTTTVPITESLSSPETSSDAPAESESDRSTEDSRSDNQTIQTTASPDTSSKHQEDEGGLPWLVIVGVLAIIVIGFVSLGLIKKKK